MQKKKKKCIYIYIYIYICHLLGILEVIFANSVVPGQTAPPEQSDQGPHCLPVCKNRFEKFARIR